MALDPVQQSLVMLASAVKEARNVLAEPDLPSSSRLAQLQRILGNELIEVLVEGVQVAIEMQESQEQTSPILEECPVCNGEKDIAGATCLRCKGTGHINRASPS